MVYRMQHFKVDFDKVKTNEDIITILKKMSIRFEDNKSVEHLTLLQEKATDTYDDLDW